MAFLSISIYPNGMGKRTSKILPSVEGKVLKYLRERKGLSMRAAGEKLGYSDSYISQIENHRENPPKGEKLDRFLALYGGMSQKSFYDMCRKYEGTDEDFIKENLSKLSKDKMKMLRSLMTTMLAEK